MTIDLMRFCSGEAGDRFEKPWSDSEYTYATNRFVLIRVPRVPEIPVGNFPDHYPDVKTGVTGRAINALPPTWYPMPALEPAYYTCGIFASGQCDGTNCEFCKDLCDGKGQISLDRDVEIGRVAFKEAALALVQVLPNIEIGPLGPHSPARIRFNGGDGLLMPSSRRRPE